MQMEFWYDLASREFSDVAERASALLDEVEHEAPEEAEVEPPAVVAVDFF